MEKVAQRRIQPSICCSLIVRCQEIICKGESVGEMWSVYLSAHLLILPTMLFIPTSSAPLLLQMVPLSTIQTKVLGIHVGSTKCICALGLHTTFFCPDSSSKLYCIPGHAHLNCSHFKTTFFSYGL